MKTAFRVAALFAIYGAIGFGGDYAAGLLAQDRDLLEPEAPTFLHVDPEVDVVVDVQPEVVVDVRVRHAGECSYTDALATVVSTAGIGSLFIDAGSGDLQVEPHDGDDIRIAAALCASEAEWLDELRVTTEERGDVLALVTHYPDQRGRSGNNTARIDLTVSVPRGFSVSIDDSSGDIEVSGTGDLLIDDSSGSIDVYDITGSLSIDDSSGDIEIAEVVGDVDVRDSSGGLAVREVAGSVAVRDGSGGIEISDVASDVRIESDGSGSIDVSRVAGDFVVDRDGSGSIECSDIQGDVLVPADGRDEDSLRRRRRRRRPCR